VAAGQRIAFELTTIETGKRPLTLAKAFSFMGFPESKGPINLPLVT
jgi:hypothetical protein